MDQTDRRKPRDVGNTPTSTVGRGKAVDLGCFPTQHQWALNGVVLDYGNSLDRYASWGTPTAIVSDGGYGVLGFDGDTTDHLNLPAWYEPHIRAWADHSTPQTTLWFWNSEIGWAAVHPILEKYGWSYVNANIWNKGKGHIAGNVNTTKIRRFPVVTEVCVQYVLEPRVKGLSLKEWLRNEWQRSELALRRANEACGVADAAVRKYLDQGHLWYYPPPEMFERLQRYANKYGDSSGRPYFSLDGISPGTAEEWARLRAKFTCPHGVTNVWDRQPLRGEERIKIPGGRAVHLNQKPLDLVTRIVRASTERGDIVWEPFGGLFTACVASLRLGRRAYGAEIDSTYFQFGVERLNRESHQYPLL